MFYQPLTAGLDPTVLVEFQRVASAIELVRTSPSIPQRARVYDKPYDGQTAIADGTQWDPIGDGVKKPVWYDEETATWYGFAEGSGGAVVHGVVGTTNQIDVDNTDPQYPVLSFAAAAVASLLLADSALQPGDIGTTVQAWSARLDAISALADGAGALTNDSAGNFSYVDYLTQAEGDVLYQPLDSDLTAIAALTTAAYGRGVLEWVDEAAARTYLGIGAITGLADPAGSIQVDLAGAVGTATTALRSDAVLILDQGIAPTWTGQHTFDTYNIIANKAVISQGSNAAWTGGAVYMAYYPGTPSSGEFGTYNYSTASFENFKIRAAAIRLSNAADREVWYWDGSSVLQYGNSTDNPQHTFYGEVLSNIGTYGRFRAEGSAGGYFESRVSGGGTNEKITRWYTNNTGVTSFDFIDDTYSAGRSFLSATRSGIAATAIAYGNSADYPAHTFYAANTNYFRGASPTMDWHFQTGGVTRGTLRTNDSFMDFFSPNQLYLEIPSLAWLDYTTGRGVLTGSASALVYGNSTDYPSHTFYGGLQQYGGSLSSGVSGASLASNLTTGRLLSDATNNRVNAYHTYQDAAAQEFSAGSTSGYVAGVAVVARSSAATVGEGVHLFVRNSVVASALSNGFHAPAVVNTTSTTMIAGYSHYLTGNATLPNFSATGQWVTIINNSGSAITITKGTTTMYNSHTGSSVSSVTLAARGRMVAECAASGVTYASGDIS